MTLIRPVDELKSISIRRRFGKNHEYGCGVYGFSDYGDLQPAGGIYRIQPVPTRKDFGKVAQYGCGVYGGISFGEVLLTDRRNIKERYYIPLQTMTPEKIASQTAFRSAILAWQALTPEQKAVYNKRAESRPMFGYNLFVREFMLAS